MYLKALEIQGFKSFPDKTRLTFEKEITAIVGPNGSGKSNISDAIQWVMGEQRSRALRGGRMEDVIFGGTDRRGKLGFAQVSLIIDNDQHILNVDSSEVMITRRYYRGGESEYYINRESVRLKDIHELLMDTGLGRDGYSIIGQGRIAEIISAKSTDRREIFEEAAGITRYRYSKEEAERKLQKTDENLLRIKDKIDELELQVGPLKKQAETAKRYLLLRDELRVAEVSVWLENLDRLRSQSEAAAADYNASKKELDAAHAAVDALYAESENYTEKMHDCDVELDRLRAVLSETESAQGECDSTVQVLLANLSSNAENIVHMHEDLERQAERARELELQVDAYRARIAEIEARCAALREALSRTVAQAQENDAEGDSSRRELAALVARESEFAAELGKRQTALGMLADAAQELLDRETQIAAETAQAEDKLKSIESALKDDKKAAQEAEESAKEKENIIAGYQMRLAGREKQAQELSREHTRLTIECGNLESRISLLTEMEKEMEGFSRAVKTVLAAAERGTLRGVRGVVAKLVRADDRYALAIETALGAAMQHIIVDDQDCGKAAIELLKQRDGGRATFLPLSAIRGQTLDRIPGAEEGCLGTALSLAQYDPEYENIFANLLGRTVVAEALGQAVRIAKKYQNRFRIVTLDGQALSAGGSMTGGSSARGTGVLSRANELKRLRGQRETMQASLADVSAKHGEAERALSAVRYELEVARGELRQAQDAALHAQAQVKQDMLVISAAEDALESLETEAASVRRRLKDNETRVASLQKEIKLQEEQLETVRAEIAERTHGSEEYEKRRAELTETLASVRSEISALETERETVGAAIGQLLALRDGMSGDSTQREDAIRSLEAQEETIRQELALKKQQLESYAKRVAELKLSIEKKRALRLELEGARTRSEKAGQEKNRALLDLERLCAKLEQKKMAFEMEESQIVDKLWESYELSFSAAQNVRQPIESMAKSQRQVSELKKQIAQLGTPNIGAIDEFERVNTRYTFLSEQRADVEKARSELLGVIADITSEMKEIFVREFRAVDENFRQTFLELFGGGRAALVLEDEENVLDCGIEIKVQPPGKALSTISLLSGGEKAFVAIALYFAIMKVRPTPFCVMDEIEAALDEANVSRFAEYMRGMAHKTQFIVITHRRGTMEEADMLYGVTMQEKGVSTVISVDLEEAEKSITK